MAPASPWPTIEKDGIKYVELPYTILKDIGSTADAPLNAAGSGIGDTTDFLTRLSTKNLWMRVGEFAVGAILIYVGLKAAFPSTVSAITSVPKTAAKIGAAGAVAA